jgi:hypothetical protein
VFYPGEPPTEGVLVFTYRYVNKLRPPWLLLAVPV